MLRPLVIVLIVMWTSWAFGQTSDTLLFRGQASVWVNLNPANNLPIWIGGRYIPQLNYQVQLQQAKLIDFEASLNLSASAGFNLTDSIRADAQFKPYRLWARYSGRQFEIRLGLQKINFGSASMLRPLMWFDQMDPRDPLQLTDGVWALLGRYYFLNNANIWLWSLYGNKEPKTWEIGNTSQQFPELGGRFQLPIPKGEAALSYHFRKTDTQNLGAGIPGHSNLPEHRIALDGKWDVGVGLWFESVWIHKTEDVGAINNQEIFNTGIDYTFGIGNGLNVVFEQLLFASNQKAFQFDNINSFTGILLSYPLGMSNQLNAIFYHDWKNNAQYNFINWRKQLNHFIIYFMAFWNPDLYRMPQQDSSAQLFGGKGIQIMFVYNY